MHHDDERFIIPVHVCFSFYLPVPAGTRLALPVLVSDAVLVLLVLLLVVLLVLVLLSYYRILTDQSKSKSKSK
jgi:hypothetical protein